MNSVTYAHLPNLKIQIGAGWEQWECRKRLSNAKRVHLSPSLKYSRKFGCSLIYQFNIYFFKIDFVETSQDMELILQGKQTLRLNAMMMMMNIVLCTPSPSYLIVTRLYEKKVSWEYTWCWRTKKDWIFSTVTGIMKRFDLNWIQNGTKVNGL